MFVWLDFRTFLGEFGLVTGSRLYLSGGKPRLP